jgi:hypothetical protein
MQRGRRGGGVGASLALGDSSCVQSRWLETGRVRVCLVRSPFLVVGRRAPSSDANTKPHQQPFAIHQSGNNLRPTTIQTTTGFNAASKETKTVVTAKAGGRALASGSLVSAMVAS